MSDGPHRSMKMRRGWKKLAEQADNSAYTPEEVSNSLLNALDKDCREEVPRNLSRRVHDILGDNQSLLFCNERVERLQSLRKEAAGHPLGNTLLDYAIQTAEQGCNGDEALREVTSKTLSDRAHRGALQVEEHYCRKSTRKRATRVRERIETGITQLNFGRLVTRLFGSSKSERPRTTKKAGIDEGVPL